MIEAQNQHVFWTPSPVISINGKDPGEFLTEFAAINAHGTLEPNADWNQMMSSPAGDIQSLQSAFEGSSLFYPGNDITFDFENGSTTGPVPWLAYIDDSPDVDIKNGQDFYTYYVLGNTPSDVTDSDSSDSNFDDSDNSTAGDDSTDTSSNSSETQSSSQSSWGYFPYPSNPNVAQPNLGGANGGVLTGYLLSDGQTAVLSIPSFTVTGGAVKTFSSTIADFLKKSKAAGCTRVIIDVQKNPGGRDLLAIDTYKQVRSPRINLRSVPSMILTKVTVLS